MGKRVPRPEYKHTDDMIYYIYIVNYGGYIGQTKRGIKEIQQHVMNALYNRGSSKLYQPIRDRGLKDVRIYIFDKNDKNGKYGISEDMFKAFASYWTRYKLEKRYDKWVAKDEMTYENSLDVSLAEMMHIVMAMANGGSMCRFNTQCGGKNLNIYAKATEGKTNPGVPLVNSSMSPEEAYTIFRGESESVDTIGKLNFNVQKVLDIMTDDNWKQIFKTKANKTDKDIKDTFVKYGIDEKIGNMTYSEFIDNISGSWINDMLKHTITKKLKNNREVKYINGKSKSVEGIRNKIKEDITKFYSGKKPFIDYLLRLSGNKVFYDFDENKNKIDRMQNSKDIRIKIEKKDTVDEIEDYFYNVIRNNISGTLYKDGTLTDDEYIDQISTNIKNWHGKISYKAFYDFKINTNSERNFKLRDYKSWFNMGKNLPEPMKFSSNIDVNFVGPMPPSNNEDGYLDWRLYFSQLAFSHYLDQIYVDYSEMMQSFDKYKNSLSDKIIKEKKDNAFVENTYKIIKINDWRKWENQKTFLSGALSARMSHLKFAHKGNWYKYYDGMMEWWRGVDFMNLPEFQSFTERELDESVSIEEDEDSIYKDVEYVGFIMGRYVFEYAYNQRMLTYNGIEIF